MIKKPKDPTSIFFEDQFENWCGNIIVCLLTITENMFLINIFWLNAFACIHVYIRDLLAQNLTTLIFVKNMSHLFVHYLLLMSLLVGGSWLKWLLSLCFPFLNLMVIDNSFYFRYAQFALQLSTNVLNIIHLSFQLVFDFFKY